MTLKERNGAIRADRAQGMQLGEIARRYGLSKGHVSNICQGDERLAEIQRASHQWKRDNRADGRCGCGAERDVPGKEMCQRCAERQCAYSRRYWERKRAKERADG